MLETGEAPQAVLGGVPAAVLVALGVGAFGLVVAWIIARWRVLSKDPGSARMVEISDAIHEGAMAFLGREYRALIVFIIVLLVVITLSPGLGWPTAVAYLVGATCSMGAGLIGMKVATRANTRTAQAAKTSFNAALNVAFPGGAVMGLSVAGLGLVGLCAVLYSFGVVRGLEEAASIITGFSLGASSIALFARVGGGIYTKAADVGGDLVGKVEAGIPEDDPRNPAVIADNVGDNVGDVAGMGADLFESYVGAIISAIVLSLTQLHGASGTGIAFALSLVSVGLIASILGLFFVRVREGGNPTAALRNGTLGAAGLYAVGGLAVTLLFFQEIGGVSGLRYFLASIAGLVSGMVVGLVAEYYTTGRRIEGIAAQSETGSATNIIAGFGTGLRSTVLPLTVIAVATLIAYEVGGFFGISLAAIGMLAITGMTVAVDAYGPIADNAGGIAEMAHLGPEIRKRTDSLDAAGNTTAAIAKGFAIGSAALTALALFTAYVRGVGAATGGADSLVMDIMDVPVLVGLFLGGVVPFLFAADTMAAVGRAASFIISEVRRQFREIPGLREGEESARADYARCVDITTAAALKEMVRPGILAVAIPLLVGSILGMETLGGLMAGALITGVPLALLLANSGGAWDNAKKFIESGHHGGKGSPAHKAAVVGDTVGDPFKDTSGPSINILLKLMAIVSIVFTPLIWKIHQLISGLF